MFSYNFLSFAVQMHPIYSFDKKKQKEKKEKKNELNKVEKTFREMRVKMNGSQW